MNQLRELRALLTPPERWTKTAQARDAHGHVVGPNHPTATCFCILGGIKKVELDPLIRGDIRDHLMINIERRFNGRFHGIDDFNDAEDTTHEDVLNLIDYAIQH